jgi:paraquat-inducible protein B
VDFRGVVVGEVKSINIDFNPVSNQFEIPVEIDFYPERLRRRYPGTMTRPIAGGPLLQRLVQRGFRAQLRTANLLTGQLYVALDFFPAVPKAQMDFSKNPPQLPTTPGSLQELQTSIANIARKLEKVPMAELSDDMRQTLQNSTKLLQRLESEIAPELRQTLQNANKLLQRLEVEIAPELKATLDDARRAISAVEGTLASDAPLQQDARETMREIARAARAFRALSDYLERHPEALIRGKREDVKK